MEEIWEIVKNLVRRVLRDCDKPDQSIWEFRTISRHFVFSKVMSWVAIDRASKIASLIKKDKYANVWEGAASENQRRYYYKWLKRGNTMFLTGI